MATLEEILTEWDKDSEIDETALGSASARNPIIHSKYLRWLSQTKLQLQKANSDYLTIRNTKARYFKGEMGKDDLDRLGWRQYQGKIPSRPELDEMLKTDPDLIKYDDKIAYFIVVKETLESILKEIGSRVWSIKNAIEFQKLMAGLM